MSGPDSCAVTTSTVVDKVLCHVVRVLCAAAALREAPEETGLTAYRVARVLAALIGALND